MLINNLEDKVLQRQACIGIIGLGYVGLPLMLCFARVGFRVLGFDTDRKKTALLTDHSCLDYDSIASHARLVVDTRNVYFGKNYGHKVVTA